MEMEILEIQLMLLEYLHTYAVQIFEKVAIGHGARRVKATCTVDNFLGTFMHSG